MFCPKCGTQQANTARACHKCNSPLPLSGRIQETPLTEQPTVINQPQEQQIQPPRPVQEQSRPVLESHPPLSWNMPQSASVNPQAQQPFEQPDKPKFSYPIAPVSQDNYQPGQYLGTYSPDYTPGSYMNQNPGWTSSNDITSGRAIASLVFGLLSFVFCPVVTAVVAIVLGKMELNAIKQGTAPPAGKSIAQIGLYTGIANVVIFVGFFLLIFLMAFLGAIR
jgi:hypothetical protein